MLRVIANNVKVGVRDECELRLVVERHNFAYKGFAYYELKEPSIYRSVATVIMQILRIRLSHELMRLGIAVYLFQDGSIYFPFSR